MLALRRAIWALVLAVSAPAAAPARSPGEPIRGLDVVTVEVRTASGRHRYQAEVASTPEAQAVGMMHRREVSPAAGMLFPFTPPRPAAFWMRNTLVALDILFIGPDGRVTGIVHRAQPLSERLHPSPGPVAAVLELKGGEAERIGLKVGDRVSWPGLASHRPGAR
ncbi:MAG: DUF192 domain-containing protein [Sphingomonadaceae bacterium]|uniref:DUF192 domain-containing protein n=1 Tax=Thermaurantiacus sp. TaxID=2820283 RepID=UPI00298EFFBA|nr:DUF192 domain-containing protein [Thermaurantiacus sp.]MCS6986157.1 DUF192 domain-containing protein [Sphingomonadaceae bacterium]MDW8414617.1 DUF192 domain-containing protein [Thermaurantiacus sp.]